jgi:hypothetical protein
MKTLLDTARGTILAGLVLTLVLWLIARWLVGAG